MNNQFTVLVFCFLFISFSQGCFEDDLSDYPKAVMFEPERQKEYPEFDGLTQFIEDGEYNFHSIIIFRDSVIFEKYFPPFTSNNIHDLNSCTKSITATMIGLAIRDGYFDNDSVNLKDAFENYRQDLLLCHLLTMSSGYEFSAFHKEQPEGDILQKLLSQPRPFTPGITFGYDEGNYHIMSNALQLKAGKKMSDYANEAIFSPLGIEQFYWEEDPDGVTRGDGLLKMIPRDMLKIGKLFLESGSWQGKQIVPKEWIVESTQRLMLPMQDKIRYGYGYGWWLPEFGGFAAMGTGGQMIYVNPDSNLVVITTGGLKKVHEMEVLTTLLNRFILMMDDTTTEISQNETGKYSPLYTSAKAAQISGKKYVFDENQFDFESITFYFEQDSIIYINFKPGDKIAFKMGERFCLIENEGVKKALKASWKNDNTLHIESQDLNYYEREIFDFYFKGTEIELKKISYPKEDTVILQGKL